MRVARSRALSTRLSLTKSILKGKRFQRKLEESTIGVEGADDAVLMHREDDCDLNSDIFITQGGFLSNPQPVEINKGKTLV